MISEIVNWSLLIVGVFVLVGNTYFMFWSEKEQ
jgi:hypothetical protein